MKRAKSSNTKLLTIKVDEASYSRIASTATKEDRSIPALFRVAMREYLDRKSLQIGEYHE